MEVKKKIHTINKNSIIKIVGFVVFYAILFTLFCKVTYLFRRTEYDRNRMAGIENNRYDMIYIGGSAAFTYWQPLKAWNDLGFTSYSYATNTIQAENIQAYIEEALTCQNPDLFVIGVRAFQYYSDDQVEAGIRNGSDGMDMTSLARYKLLNNYFSNRTMTDETDVLSYYLDISKYHTNTANLGSETAWKFIDNNETSHHMGWEWLDQYAYLDSPTGFETEERAELPANDKKILLELLDYCKQEELNVLFVVCPYYVTIEDQAKYNTIGDIVKSYGFTFLNANNYYDEIGIDFTTDYYDKNHVNLFGAEKYTAFLENYLSQNYTLPDHRGDPSYESWNKDYQRFSSELALYAETVTNLRLDVEKGNEIEKQLMQTDNFSEWYNLVNDNRYKLLIANASPMGDITSLACSKILNGWSIDLSAGEQIRVIQNAKIAYTNASDQALVFDGAAGIWFDHNYHISVENGNASISVDGEKVINSSDGICIVVYDNSYRRIADAVILRADGEKIYITRE